MCTLPDMFRFWQCGQHRSATRPVFLDFRSSISLIVASVALSIFVDVFLYSIVVPILPFALQSKIGIPGSQVQRWTSILLAAYGGSLLITSAVCGCVSDKIQSRRMPFMVGLGLLASAMFCLGFGSTVGAILAGRLLQGASAAVVWTAGIALLVDTVGSGRIGVAMGYVSLGNSLGLLFGPVVGGQVFRRGGYGAVFSVCYALLVLDVLLRLVIIEKKVKHQWLGRGLSRANRPPVAPPADDELPAGSNSPNTTPNGSTLALLGNQWSRASMKMPTMLSIFFSVRALAAIWATLSVASIITALEATVPLQVRQVFEWDSTGAGLILVALFLPSLGSIPIGKLVDRYGSRFSVASGFGLMGPFLIAMRVVDQNSTADIIKFAAFLCLTGIGMALVFGPLMAEFSYIAEAGKRSAGSYGGEGVAKTEGYAQGYALFNMAYGLGSLIGPLWAGEMRDRFGWGTTTLSLGVMSLVTAVLAVLFTGGSAFDSIRRRPTTGPASEDLEAPTPETRDDADTPVDSQPPGDEWIELNVWNANGDREESNGCVESEAAERSTRDLTA